MYQNEFIPAVFKLQFKSDSPMTPEEWEEMIGSLMGVYAKRISEKEKTFIGHIKGAGRAFGHSLYQVQLCQRPDRRPSRVYRRK